MESQDKLNKDEEKDEFVESLNLTPKKIKEDMEKMKEIEGFPKGDDDDILNLSNPPYYTAYPNPYIKAFIEKFGKKYDERNDDYHKEPYVGDISEGKNDPVYSAHSYHTKVPHKAIMNYITHYSEKEDIIFDGFAGTGMTAIAAQLLGRKAIVSDLSPVASFIASNYNRNIDYDDFKQAANEILREVTKECSWMYETLHTDGKTKGRINYTVFTDVFICPHCKNEYLFFEAAFDKKEKAVLDKYKCPACNSEITKQASERATFKSFDIIIGKDIVQTKQLPVLINYSVNNKKFEKKPDEFDFKLIKKVSETKIPFWFPIMPLPSGENTQQPRKSHGIEYIHHFYSQRSLWVLSSVFHHIKKTPKNMQPILTFTFEQSIFGMSKLARYVPTHYSQVNQYLTGTLYIASQIVEPSLEYVISGKIKRLQGFVGIISKFKDSSAMVSTQSTTDLSNVSDNSIDYIFTDPPFGSNIMYSELNILWESWIKVVTNKEPEAIINNVQNKELEDYRVLMSSCFSEYQRILKPNRWITVEFHNSQAQIWKCIQESLIKAGFIIGQVAILDKKQGSFKQITSVGAVKNDLVINAYKPSESFRTNFLKKAGLNMEHDFIKMHLDKLPVEPNIERTPQMLYSKLLAQYIQNGFEVRMDASDFYSTLRNHFTERDNFWFNSGQIKEYEKRLKLKQTLGKADLDQTIIGINDEKTAIIWLASFLRKPKTYDEIYIDFSKKIMTSEDKMPELKIILEENFVTEDGMYQLPSQCQKKEREDMRIKRLMREFEHILEAAAAGKKITEVRKDALLVGLMKLYQEKNVDQIKLLAKKLDKKIIESDDDINAIIDWALSKGD